MKRQIKEAMVQRRRGPTRVVTYGYDTKINGLDIIGNIDGICGKFTVVHVKSGYSIGIYFGTASKAFKFANKYLTGFDFTQDSEDLLRDGKLGECVLNAKIKKGV